MTNMSQVVLITGAGSGFGRLTAERLARRGFHVFATMRDPDGRNANSRREIEKTATDERLRLEVVELDVTSESSVQSCIAEVQSRCEGIDIVVNNAAFSATGITEAFTADEFLAVFETNFFGVVRVNRAVLPAMRRRGRGLLVHVSSGMGRLVLPYFAPYCASKFALEALADAYRFELAPFGIDSVLIEPGPFRTPIFQKSFEPADTARAAGYQDADFSARVKQAFNDALSDVEADPAEVAAAILRLIETAAGQRPLRTLVGAGIQRLAPYNELAEKFRGGLARAFGVENLLALETAAAVHED
jgi:NAD(P)-dependent dehydrogenase (short-subunit alcohol dehydrogenase family)